MEVFHDIVNEAKSKSGGEAVEIDKAALAYIAIAVDKMLNWNALLSSWNVEAVRLRSVFDRHDFAFKWSFGEMAPTIAGLGYDWAIEQTGKCIEDIIKLLNYDKL